jgi:hypothetical protein
MTNRLHREEAGLVGKVVVVWLLVLAVFLLVAFDSISILFSKYRVADLAGNAASEAAYTYKNTGDLQQACQAAVDYVASHDSSAKIPQAGCAIDKTSGDVTITVKKTANTLVAQRLSATEDLTHQESTETVPAPI